MVLPPLGLALATELPLVLVEALVLEVRLEQIDQADDADDLAVLLACDGGVQDLRAIRGDHDHAAVPSQGTVEQPEHGRFAP